MAYALWLGCPSLSNFTQRTCFWRSAFSSERCSVLLRASTDQSIRWNLTAGAARPNPQGSYHYGRIKISKTYIFANSVLKVKGKQRYMVNGVSSLRSSTPLKLADYLKLEGVFHVGSIPDHPTDWATPSFESSVIAGNFRAFVEIVFENPESTAVLAYRWLRILRRRGGAKPLSSWRSLALLLSRLMAQRSWGESWSDLFRRNVPTVVQTAQRYLELARECMEHVQSMTSRSVCTSLQFNHAQCEYLVDKLTVAVQSVEVWAQLNSSGFNSECVRIMKILCRSAKEVERFIQGCCNDNWIQAAIVLVNMFEYVSLLGFNLDVCTLLLLNNNTVTSWQLDALSIPAISEIVKERVSHDQSTLLTRLETVIHSSNSNDQESQLAKCLSGRLRQYLSGSVQLNVWDIDSSSLRRVQRLGSGSAAMVHKSIWLTGQIEVAEKVFYGSDHPSFKNEVQVLAGLTHPNIVPLLGYAMDESRCSIAMELMDGDLLFLMEARLQENHTCKFPFTNFEAVDMMLQIAKGMLYLHENRVVHRDLKSQNILVKSRKDIDAEYIYVKVADFGLAKTKENSITQSNQTMNVGTTRWMAPELLTLGADDLETKTSDQEQELSYPFKVDIYSFGMVCYEILTGKVPFSTISSFKKVKKMVLNGDRPVLPDQCPDTLKTLIHSCWETEPSSRPSFKEICKSLKHLKYFLMTVTIRTEGSWCSASDANNMPSNQRQSNVNGVHQDKGVRSYRFKIPLPFLKQAIGLGSYNTAQEAAGASDAGEKKITVNPSDYEWVSQPAPHLRIDLTKVLQSAEHIHAEPSNSSPPEGQDPRAAPDALLDVEN